MNKYVYAPYSYKVDCPSCGGKKSFKPVWNSETQQLLPYTWGICDHVNSCQGTFLTASFKNLVAHGYLREFGSPQENFFTVTSLTNVVRSTKPIEAKPNYHKRELLYFMLLQPWEFNNFYEGLQKLFPGKDIKPVLAQLYATAKGTNGVTFWQVDSEGKIRGGKVHYYKEHSFKREGSPHWVHNPETFNLSQTWFGHHLIKDTSKPIGIVEGHKTMVYLSLKWNQFTWIAAGQRSIFLLKEVKYWQEMKGKKIILFPDTDGQKEWEKIAQGKQKQGYDVRCSTQLYNSVAAGAKLDLADFPSLPDSFILKELRLSGISLEQVEELAPIPLEKVEIVNRLISINPAVAKLLWKVGGYDL